MKKLLVITFVVALGGCSSQFGTRLAAPAMPYKAPPKVQAVPVPAPVAQAPAPVTAPSKPTLRQRLKADLKRHPIKWVH